MKICSFLWKRVTTGFRLPAVCDYGPAHVARHKRAFERHLKIPHEYLCITDSPELVPEGIRTIPLWDKCRDLGGCFNRLFIFSPEMREIIGPRFACVDLDCVVTADVTDIFSRKDDFIINRYVPFPGTESDKDQMYNGSLILMDAGARRKVWDRFDPRTSPARIAGQRMVVGSDQAWIRIVLGRHEWTVGPEDGIYEARNIGANLPENARMVFFSGRRDPSLSPHEWVKRNWA